MSKDDPSGAARRLSPLGPGTWARAPKPEGRPERRPEGRPDPGPEGRADPGPEEGADRPRSGSRRKAASLPDEVLAERLRGGDREAFRALYDRHAADAYHLASFLLGSEQEAEDVVQEAFFEVYVKAEALRDPAKLRAWLMAKVCGIARRRRTRLRRLLERLGVRRGGGLESLERLIDPAASPERRAMLVQSYGLLRDLPLEDRAAWLLFAVWGHTTEEIAEMTACSPATVKRRLGRARQMLAASGRR